MAIDQKLVSDLYSYNPDTGLFLYKERPRKYFKTDGSYKAYITRYAGKVAGFIDKNGYHCVGIFGKDYRIHRLIYLYMTGSNPEDEVDHINGVRDDNRWVNLRGVSKKDNTKNKCMRSNNTSGIQGVYQIKSSGKWRARISTEAGRYTHLGCFPTPWDAMCARKSAELKHGYHENHGRLNTGDYL